MNEKKVDKIFLVKDEPTEIYGDLWVGMKNINMKEAIELTPELEEEIINKVWKMCIFHSSPQPWVNYEEIMINVFKELKKISGTEKEDGGLA